MTRSKVLFAPNGALRAPWRILVFVAVMLVAWVAAGIVLSPLLVRAAAVTGGTGTVNTLVALAGVLISTLVCVRFVDHRTWTYTWMGARAAHPRAWAEGFLLGALAIGVPCLVLLASGQFRIAPSDPGSWMVSALRVSWFLLPAALMEELLTRGYLLAVLRESLGWRPALAITSLIFGLLHLPNNGANAQAIVNVMLAGVFLGAVVLATGSIYAGWMAHFGWNWMMAVPLHSPVSGFPLATPDYHLVDAGPGWLTGGAWGPEGGLAAAAGLMAGLAYLYARRTRREES